MKGFFKCTLFMELSLFYLAFLDARLWVLFAYNFRCRGAKAYSTVGITIEWLTTIEQLNMLNKVQVGETLRISATFFIFFFRH